MWKVIPDFSNYEVNKSGQIRNRITKRILHTYPNKDNYLRVQVVNDFGITLNMYVHRLVAKAYLANPHNLQDVNHKNNKRQDNRVINLEWLSRSDNIRQVWSTGAKRKLRKHGGGITDYDSRTTNCWWCILSHCHHSNITIYNQ